MDPRINIYDQVSNNKRTSYLLFFLFIVITFFLSFFIAEYFGGGGDSWIISLICLCFAGIWIILSYYAGDRMILALNNAREVKKEDYPYLFNIVEGLSIAAGITAPKIYVIEDAAPNAFATGRDPKHASITVTKGLLEKMNRLELEGVIAHEMSHIRNYDIRYMMIVIIMVGFIGILANMIVRIMFSSRGRGERGKGAGLLILIGLLFVILSPIFAKLVQLAISREREYLADASAALITRYPQGLADALKKIAADQTPATNVNEDMASLYIANPLKKKSGLFNFSSLFSTHPPIEERIRILESM